VADVIVIDDDPDIQSLLEVALGLDGHSVRTAGSGDEGIGVLRDELAAGRDPVVVLDVQMPAVDGWMVLARVRGDEQTRDATVVLCTVKAESSDLDRGWALGCDAYFSKPFDIAAVSAQVTELASIGVDERWRLRHERAERLGAS
jgi:CheY-like chemotaxis protein